MKHIRLSRKASERLVDAVIKKLTVTEEKINKKEFIVQVIPCKKTLYATYRVPIDLNGTKRVVEEKIEYLALCADGAIHPLYFLGGRLLLGDDEEIHGDIFLGLNDFSIKHTQK